MSSARATCVERKAKRKLPLFSIAKGGSSIVVADEKRIEVSEEEYQSLLRRNRNLALVKTIFESILNRRSKGKMFNVVTETWNPVTGCLYHCNYCWARQLATTKLKNSHRYTQGFKPMLNEVEFRVKFDEGDLIFVSDMGDLFGDFIPSHWIQRVLEHTARFPKAHFLFLTKNPVRYREFLHLMPENAILGATIETSDDQMFLNTMVSEAPSPSERHIAMRDLAWDKKIISIEPVLDFELETFSLWIKDILPFLVYVGYDNYGNKLKEPPLGKTLRLLDEISENTLVIKKTIRPAWFETSHQNLGDWVEQ